MLQHLVVVKQVIDVVVGQLDSSLQCTVHILRTRLRGGAIHLNFPHNLSVLHRFFRSSGVNYSRAIFDSTSRSISSGFRSTSLLVFMLKAHLSRSVLG